MTSSASPDVMCIGQARLTAGLDRFERIDLATHREVFGTMPRLEISRLIDIAERVDLRGRGGAGFPVGRKLQGRAAVDPSAQAQAGRACQRHGGGAGQRQGRDAVAAVPIPRSRRSPGSSQGAARHRDHRRGNPERHGALGQCRRSGGAEPAANPARRPGAGQVRLRRGRCAGQRREREGRGAARPQDAGR